MRAKRYSVEQIVAKLREAQKLQAQGQTIAQVCKRLGISDQTFFRWRIGACRNFALRKTVIRPGWDHTASMGYRRPPQRRHPRRTEAKFLLYALLRRHGTQSRRGPPSRAALNDVSLEAQGTPSGPSATSAAGRAAPAQGAAGCS